MRLCCSRSLFVLILILAALLQPLRVAAVGAESPYSV